MNKNLKNIVQLFILFGMLSCRSNEGSNQERESYKLDTIQLVQSEYNIMLPPVDLLFDLKSFDLDFTKTAVNSYSIADNYTSQRSKTINLGIYMADFSYLSAIEERFLLPKYMNNIKYLSDELRIVGLFDEKSTDRFRSNLSNPDSLYYLSQETHDRLVNILESSNRHSTLVHISIGGAIESMFLFFEPIDNKEKFQLIVADIENYSFVLNEYYSYALKMINDPFLGETVIDLKGLLKEFELYERRSGEVDVIKSDSNHLHISAEEKIHVDYEGFLRLKGEVTRIRNMFVLMN